MPFKGLEHYKTFSSLKSVNRYLYCIQHIFTPNSSNTKAWSVALHINQSNQFSDALGSSSVSFGCSVKSFIYLYITFKTKVLFKLKE